MQPTTEQIKTLQDLNLGYRFHDHATTYMDNPTGGRALVDTSKPPCVMCDVFDLTTRVNFFSDKGSTEGEAFEKALAGALVAEKPLTPAQLADPRYRELGQLQRENATLKERLRSLEPEDRSGNNGASRLGFAKPKDDSEEPAKRKPGRPRKNPLPESALAQTEQAG